MTTVDTNAAALAAGVKPATIRDWARRGLLCRVGSDNRARALWDLDQVDHVATQLKEKNR